VWSGIDAIRQANDSDRSAMVVEESRILQVSIFNTLQTNLGSVDFGTVLFDVMKQAMLGFTENQGSKAGES
jgi:hypothetical protein